MDSKNGLMGFILIGFIGFLLIKVFSRKPISQLVESNWQPEPVYLTPVNHQPQPLYIRPLGKQETKEYSNLERWSISWSEDGLPTEITIHRESTH